jgi:hypothetical protein
MSKEASPHIRIDGQIREAPILKRFLASNCDWRERVERRVRKSTESVWVSRTDYDRIRIYICVVEGDELAVRRTSNWGGSKRLRMYEAGCVVGIEVDGRGMPIAPLDAVIDRITAAAIAVAAQVLLLLRAPREDVEPVLREAGLNFDLLSARRRQA